MADLPAIGTLPFIPAVTSGSGATTLAPLDEKHLWEALRYIELNPVRANLAPRAPDWQWSSAAVHCGAAPVPAWLEMGAWARRWSTDHWSAYLQTIEGECSLAAIRDSTHSGRPLGSRRAVTDGHDPLRRAVTTL